MLEAGGTSEARRWRYHKPACNRFLTRTFFSSGGYAPLGQHLHDGYTCLSGSANVSTGEYRNVTRFDNITGGNITVSIPEVLDCTHAFMWFIIFV